MLLTMCSNTLKSNKLKVDDSLKENKLACFTKAHFRYLISFVISEKSFTYDSTTYTFPHLWWCTQVPKSHSKQGMQKKFCTTISDSFNP